MFCKKCGNKIADDAIVCTKCGVPTGIIFNEKKETEEVGQIIIIVGYILAFLMPIVGGIVGIYMMAKRRPGHGIAMLVLAVMSSVFWFDFYS